MLLLLLSILVLVTGPLLHGVVQRDARLKALLDGFIVVGVGGLIMLHVLPESVNAIGVVAFVAMLCGVMLPVVLDRFGSMVARGTHAVIMVIALLGLLVHTLLDGVTLAAFSHAEVSAALAMAVVVHRLPVAVAIWWLVRQPYGRRAGWAALIVVAAATLTGFAVENHLHQWTGGPLFAYIQAFVAGSLLHVMLHHDHDHDAEHEHPPTYPFAEALGGLLGGLLVAAMPFFERLAVMAPASEEVIAHSHHLGHHHHAEVGAQVSGGLIDFSGFLGRLQDLFMESAPALLLGYVLAGLFAVFLPRATMAWMRGGSALSQSARGVLFGLPLPICSCGVVPLYRSLIHRGVPMGAAIAFLVATPELGIEALLLSIPLLGVELTLARLIAAAAVAMIVALLMNVLLAPAPAHSQEHEHHVPEQPLGARIKSAARFGLGDVVDETAAWIMAGLAIAALISPGGLVRTLEYWPAGLDVVLFAILSLPVYVCASGATPLAAALIFAGASPGAALAFLLAGPASNLTTLGVLRELHGWRASAYFGVLMVALAMAAGWITNIALADVSLAITQGAQEHVTYGAGQWACALALVLIFGASYLRQGPRAWLNTILSVGEDEHHHHTHHDDHDPSHHEHAHHAHAHHDHHHDHH